MSKKPHDIAVTAVGSSNNARVATFPDNGVVLSKEDIALIQDIILIGLASYGEVQKMVNLQGLFESMGRDWPLPNKVLDPTADVETISRFADALRTIQFM